MPRLEVRIAASPWPNWINRARLIAASIRRFYPDALVRVTVGADMGFQEILALLPMRCGIDWHILPRAKFNEWQGTRSAYLNTMLERYRGPFDGDYIMMLDCDVFCIQDFTELFDINALAGMQVHHSPYGVFGWIKLWQMYGLTSPRLNVEHVGHGPMFHDNAERFGPFCPNSGMVFGRREWFEALAAPYSDAIRFLRDTIGDTYWFDQVGLALAIARTGVPTHPLPLRWNFPNRPAFDRWAPSELAKVKFLHAMQTDVVDRERVFTSSDAVDRLCARADLDGSNEVLRQLIADVRGEAGL